MIDKIKEYLKNNIRYHELCGIVIMLYGIFAIAGSIHIPRAEKILIHTMVFILLVSVNSFNILVDIKDSLKNISETLKMLK